MDFGLAVKFGTGKLMDWDWFCRFNLGPASYFMIVIIIFL